MAKKLEFSEGSDNLFKDFGFSESEAKKLKLRSSLMIILIKYIQKENITQTEAAKRFSVAQSRISNLIRGRIDLFSNDMLIEMLETVGFEIYDNMQKDVNKIIHRVTRAYQQRISANASA